MSQITLNQFFTIQQPEPVPYAIEPPKREIFTVLPQQPINQLQRLCNVTRKVETFQSMQNRLVDATTHEKRDRMIAYIVGAIMIGLVAGIVLGSLFCPPVAIASAVALFVLGFTFSAVVACIASKDHRDHYEMIKYADIFCIGWPRIIAYFLTRKHAIENNINSTKQEIATDLLDAGRYLQQNGPAIREKLEQDVQLANHLPVGHFSYETQAIAESLAHQIEKSRNLLVELNTKGMPMVASMIHAGLLQA